MQQKSSELMNLVEIKSTEIPVSYNILTCLNINTSVASFVSMQEK